MLARVEAADSRIQALQTFAATATLGLPLFARAIRPDISFTSSWFLAALGVFLMTVVFGLVARSWGHIILVNPDVIYQRWLHFYDWEFRKTAIYWAGKHFETNAALVNAKGWMGVIMSAFLGLEVLLLVAWIMR